MTDIDLSEDTPTALIPKMGEFAVSNSAFYKQLIMTEAIGGSDAGDALSGSIDPFSAEPPGEQSPTTGVLLTFEQGWFQKGLALGELRKSLSLAPGEVTKLAVVDWRRQSRSSDSSTRTDVDIASDRSNAQTNVEAVQQGVSRYAERGSSVSVGSSTHGEVGGSVGGLFASASASASHSSHMGFSASSATGSRSVAQAAAKDVQRSTEQLAQSTRSSRATQIVEVNESEQQSTTTRVVANYNHAHALTMQYFEVLQIYTLSTKVVRADRCVFVPMQRLDFEAVAEGREVMSDATVELLREVLIAFGAKTLDAMVADFHAKAPMLTEQITDLNTSINQAQVQLDAFSDRRAAADELVARAQGDLTSMQQAAPAGTIEIPPFGFEIPNPEVLVFELQVLKPLQDLLSQAKQARAALNTEEAEVVQRLAGLNASLTEKQLAMTENNRLFGILAKHEMFINQQMWMRIDDYQWHRKLQGRTFPHGEYQGQEIGGLINPKPVGYFGNFVAFMWDFPPGTESDAKTFEDTFTSRSSTRTTIALPTEGVFGEAVLGQANSAEKIDLTRFWNWQDSPIPILPPALGPVSTNSRAGNVVAPPPPLDFGPALVKLRELGIETDVSDDAILAALQSAGSANQGHLIAAAATAGITAANNASDGAGRAGQRSIDAIKNAQDFAVGLANSEAGKLAVSAIAAGGTGGATTVGGLLNAATKASKVIDLTTKASDKDKIKK